MRFIFVRPKEYYLRLDKTRDVIEWQLDDIYDINGWDINKLLRLLHSANPTIFEWNMSPIVYHKAPEWDEVSRIIYEYFKAKPCLYHYLSMAKTHFSKHFRENYVNLKKYFYVLRPLLVCRWILQHNKPAPVRFEDLLHLVEDNEVLANINKLLEIKKQSSESMSGERIGILDSYIETQIKEIEAVLAQKKEDRNAGWDMLNDCFLSVIY